MTESELLVELELLTQSQPAADRNGFSTTAEMGEVLSVKTGRTLRGAVEEVKRMLKVAEKQGRLERGRVMMQALDCQRSVQAYKLKEA